MFDVVRLWQAVAAAHVPVKPRCQLSNRGRSRAVPLYDAFELPRFLLTRSVDRRELRLAAALCGWAGAGRAAFRKASFRAQHAVSLVLARWEVWSDADHRSDVGLVAAVAVGGVVFLCLAVEPGSAARNTKADAIAAMFAGSSTIGPDLEERLDFAPLLAVALSTRPAGLGRIKVSQRTAPRSLPFDALGALVVRGLPVGASLSPGVLVDGSRWVVAQGDVANLQVSLAGLTQTVDVEVDVIARDGVTKGTFGFSVSPAEVASIEGPGLSGIRTGALPPSLEGDPTVRRRVSLPPAQENRPPKRAVRAKKKANTGRDLATAPNVVKLPFKPAAPAQLPATPLTLFKPAGDMPSVKPAAAVRKRASAAAKPPAFPRGPMEEEAARR